MYSRSRLFFIFTYFILRKSVRSDTLEYLFEIIIRTFILLLSVYQIAVVARVLFEFFIPESDENLLLGFVQILTNPGLILCEKLLSLLGMRTIGPFNITPTVSILIAYILKMTLRALI